MVPASGYLAGLEKDLLRDIKGVQGLKRSSRLFRLTHLGVGAASRKKCDSQLGVCKVWLIHDGLCFRIRGFRMQKLEITRYAIEVWEDGTARQTGLDVLVATLSCQRTTLQ